MSTELLSISLIILSFLTSPITTKAAQTGTKIPSLLYIHTPLYLFALCYGPDRFLSLIVASTFILVFTAGATIYVWYKELW